MWHVYILLCSNGDYYKVCTNDLEKRIQQHQTGKVDSTKDLLPLLLITYITFKDKGKAFEFEKYLKSGSGRAFLKKHLV
jgi:putative endonuclease